MFTADQIKICRGYYRNEPSPQQFGWRGISQTIFGRPESPHNSIIVSSPKILMSRLQKEYLDGSETHGSRMVMAAPIKEFHQKEKSRRPILYHELRPLENPKNYRIWRISYHEPRLLENPRMTVKTANAKSIGELSKI